jgi:hypothetical protein
MPCQTFCNNAASSGEAGNPAKHGLSNFADEADATRLLTANPDRLYKKVRRFMMIFMLIKVE